MTAVARRVVIVVLAAALASCGGSPPGKPSDPAAPTGPAMALPDNAVDRAVANLDGIIADFDGILRNRGLPLLSCTAERVVMPRASASGQRAAG